MNTKVISLDKVKYDKLANEKICSHDIIKQEAGSSKVFLAYYIDDVIHTYLGDEMTAMELSFLIYEAGNRLRELCDD